MGASTSKDAPAIDNAGYTIAGSITGDSGEAFLANLTSAQRPLITNIVADDKSAITGIVEQRRAIATELRKALASGAIDEPEVRDLAREYGSLDGEISYRCAMAFSAVGRSLSADQKASLVAIRDLANYPTENGTIYLYSDKIDRPAIPDTDFLFR